MLKNLEKKYVMILRYVKNLLFFFLIFFVLSFIYSNRLKNLKYSFFIEFNDANGIVKGTPIRMRGVTIGSIRNIQLKLNSVVVLATINSNKIVISKDAMIETTQTGFLNESVIDIVPLKKLNVDTSNGPLSLSCDSSTIICNNMYLLGDRGLNYDDLVRSTTRISQRFDDPSFFYLFYTFLKNSAELVDSLSVFLKNIFDVHGAEKLSG